MEFSYGENMRKDVTEECKSEYWMSTEKDERNLD